MDDLTAALATSFQVSSDPNSTAAPHPRFAEYKKKGGLDQDERRKRHLELQKQKRYDYTSHTRSLTEGVWDRSDSFRDERATEIMDYEVTLQKPGRHYKNQLMYSEWLVEVPDDFEQEWMMVICPVGKRSLIVASRGSTSAYAKSGYEVNTFPSVLPGGNRHHKSKHGEATVMDCVFDEVHKTFFVLDLMCWKSQPIYDSETEFRFYWLQTKFQENPEMAKLTGLNKYKFVPLPSFPCTKQVISDALSATTFQIDGLLFYHKRTHYTFGSTPLVVWLKPYMLPEILGIHEPAKILSQKPSGYTNYATHMEAQKTKQAYGASWKTKKALKKSAKAKSSEGMEVAPSDSTNTSVDSGASGGSRDTSVDMGHSEGDTSVGMGHSEGDTLTDTGQKSESNVVVDKSASETGYEFQVGEKNWSTWASPDGEKAFQNTDSST